MSNRAKAMRWALAAGELVRVAILTIGFEPDLLQRGADTLAPASGPALT